MGWGNSARREAKKKYIWKPPSKFVFIKKSYEVSSKNIRGHVHDKIFFDKAEQCEITYKNLKTMAELPHPTLVILKIPYKT
jgi:hypothetical protein